MNSTCEAFGEDYFVGIWGTVHRHDYCRDRAKRLILKYGAVSFLDVGAGCGYLVKTLRELGADAWGIDISRYALENSCDPERVREGDIRDIPFGARFDVVHSQGVWQYVPESDVKRAWAECRRVGKFQEHNLDTSEGDNPPEHHCVTVRPRQWWKDQFYPPVLVACPNHEVKEYAFERWIRSVRGLTYPNFDVLVVDNSPNGNFAERWNDQVRIVRIDPAGIEHLAVLRINLSYERIREEMLAGNYERLMIIESDIIPPPDIIERLVALGNGGDWISHAYPDRVGPADIEVEQGIGCSLFSRRLMETHGFKSLGDNYTADGGLWNKVRPDRRFATTELWNFLTVQHLVN